MLTAVDVEALPITGGFVAGSIGVSGTVYVNPTGALGVVSDERLKTDISDTDVGLRELLLLKPRKFRYVSDQLQNASYTRGFIAQEVQTILPEAVDELPRKYVKEEWNVSIDDTILVVKPEEIWNLTVRSIQELHARLELAEAVITSLQVELNDIKNKNSRA